MANRAQAQHRNWFHFRGHEVANVRGLSVSSLAALLLLPACIPNRAIANADEPQICDVRADYFLGVENYSQAIRVHREILRKDPSNALAHYHLGFAHGMVGDRSAEVSEYLRAEALGMRNWDLLLNLGLAQIEDGDLEAATDSLRRAVQLGPGHSESHANLALVYEKRGMLADAEHEAVAALQLNPEQLEMRNLLGVIYARERNAVRASSLWREILIEVPDYQPALRNLEILGSQIPVANGETAAVALPPAAAVRAIIEER